MTAAREGVRALGEEISQGEGLPPEVGPVVFAFTGRGKVAQGTWVGVLGRACVWIDTVLDGSNNPRM